MSGNNVLNSVHGILLVDKPLGQSSNKTLQQVKSIFKAQKAGHTGNLDVLASGLLPVCFGEATKVSQFLLNADKRYLAEFTLGRTTTTGDSEGEETSSPGFELVETSSLVAAVKKLTGEILQIPPMYSALKVEGKRLYSLAREGVEIEREERAVTIFDFDIVEINFPLISVHVHCSKGTYIRVLAEDLGKLLGCGGYMSKLERISSGPFKLADAHSVDYLQKFSDANGQDILKGLLIKPDEALKNLPEVGLTKPQVQALRFGQIISFGAGCVKGAIVRLYDQEQNFFGLGVVGEEGTIAPKRLFNL